MSRMYQGFSCKLTNHFRRVCGTFSLLTSDAFVVYLFVKQFLITPNLWNRFTFYSKFAGFACLLCGMLVCMAYHVNLGSKWLITEE
ncbi:hypothetical protein L1987_62252 [Smallanthus sonchifolius]|uniref:Uncharacterized protein n=1 Tax=Smallanthus sonchifolius TaxID=185202 RepID=A0ACB9C9X8_9ASTR|nr:hypothetical protein L1987_62252 [Smallanthus sonchifolius]